jgi:hypothetical protein
MSWSRTSVAKDGTHHLLEEVPLYEPRFEEVLKFHAPGLAPVRIGNSAWHIQLDGSPAYPQRYRRTFGFYQERASFQDEEGWGHILPCGRELYTTRFAWCGNFQEGLCPVRSGDGSYFHLTLEGKPAYTTRWRYAGDFRDGVGVIQASDGRSTHIDATGRILHGNWFLDLDVFHKGYARAKDEEGWTHVDQQGRQLYSRRFASVEPFYNGQARVEQVDGSLAVIDEGGETVAILRRGLP